MVLGVAGCAAGDPEVTATATPGATPTPTATATATATPTPIACPLRPVDRTASCPARDGDYRPGEANDAWPACVSDDGTYHRIEESVSTIGRVAAFEAIADLLWRRDGAPSAQDFIDARIHHAQEQGLDSRVQRREDVHYPADAMGRRCADAGVPEENPERCVGPAKLLPVLNDAFARGAAGEAPRVHAARIEAALLFFLYVSSMSEWSSCRATPKDCDSCWAYYSGGTPREAPLGLARVVQGLSDEAHQRAYDALLGVRCWRNLDNETGVATDEARHARIGEQLDRALLHGLSLVVRERFLRHVCNAGGARDADRAFLGVMVPLFDRAVRERDVPLADRLLAAVGRAGGEALDGAAADAGLAEGFACP
jgi:hypothetical protein